MKRLRSILSVLLCVMMVLSFSVSAAEEETFQWELEKEVLLASLWEADIATLRQAMDMGWITSVELTQYYLERIEAYNDTYNCFITLCDDALEQAEDRDADMAAGETIGVLHGIPIVIKDNMDLSGYHTTSGHSKKSSQIADSNAQVVEYVLQEGAVIIGKTNMSTDAQDARASSSYAVGETKNAYNSYMASGGSSGGSAVATSLNFAVAGLGTDTNSSLRFPAVLNGCISLRTTWGTLSMDGIDKLNSTRDVPGAITRTVMDQAIMLDVLSGGETNYAENLNPDILDGLRIGVLKELSYPINSFRSEKNIDDEVEAAFQNAITELEACGAVVVEISIPNVLSLADSTMSSNKSSLKEKMYDVIVAEMEEHDVAAVIFPSYLHTPLRSGRDSSGKYWSVYDQTYINNTSQFSSCASLPEIGIPIDYHSLGAGIGMEIAARKNQEQLLLDIAYAYTTRYDHRMAPVNAPDLYTDYTEATLSELIDTYYAEKAAYESAQQQKQEDVPEFLDSPPEEETEPVPDTTVPVRENNPEKTDIPEILIVVLVVLILSLCVCVIILAISRRKEQKSRKGSFARK